MLFSDLSESTRFAASMEAEQYADFLGDLRRSYHDVIPRHGGTIVQIQGDGVLAVFGYPEAGEDDGRRATEAALDLHDMVRKLQPGVRPGQPALSLHSGIHSGLVLFDEGDLLRGRFELLGTATNIAKHLADVAANDEILVSQETLGPESHFFQTSERRQVQLRGKSEPIAAYRILARAPVNTRFEARARRGLAPFVGREAEIRVLDESLRDAKTGKSVHLAIAAAPGMGKTRLAEEFLSRAAAGGFRVHRGFCESYLGAEPLQPFLQMLRVLFGLTHGMPGALAAEAIDRTLDEIGPALKTHRTEFMRALSLGGDDSASRGSLESSAENTIDALRALFDRLAAAGPLAVFIDDMQWADDATRLLIGVIRSLERRAILVLTTSREISTGDANLSAARILQLAPFSEAETAQTIDRLLPGSDPFTVAEIWKYSGGNPLYIEELCHSAARGDAAHGASRIAGSKAWLDTLIASRVARLRPDQAELVRAAAVIGNVIPSWLLESITGCGESDPRVRNLSEEDFIFPGDRPGTLRFKHGITRDVIYHAVDLHQRRAMHLRVADALRQKSAGGAQEETYEALAYHYGAGGKLAEAADFAELAGDKASAASALDRAQAQYLAALAAIDLLDPSDANYRRWIAIAQRLALASVFDPSRESIGVLQRATTLAAAREDKAAIVIAEYWLGYINYGIGEARAAIRHCETALELARPIGNDPLRVQILATLGQAKAAACEYGPALVLLDDAIAVKRRHRSSARPSVGLSYTLTCRASVLGDRGQFAEAHECFAEALDAVRDADHAVKGSLYCWQSAVYLWQGRWEDAQRTGDEAQNIAARVKSLYLFAMGRALWAYGGWMLTQAPEFLRAIQDATSWMEARGKERCISLNYGWLADASVTIGRFQDVRVNAVRALARGRKADRLGEAMACRAMARSSAQGRDRQSADHYLALAMKVARTRESPHEIAITQVCQAEIELSAGNAALARDLLDQATVSFGALGMDWHRERAAKLHGTI